MNFAGSMDAKEESAPLISEQPEDMIRSRIGNKNTVDAEFIRGQVPATIGKEAASMWPGDIEVQVPEDWKAGEKVAAEGPHGRFFFTLPEDAKAGTTQRFPLRPAADLRIEVPKGISEGQSMTFERADGTRISITVPKGKVAGDTFEVLPPAAMVLVPEDAKAGDMVCFPLPGPPTKQWFSAKVPEELQLGLYFAARLPPPDNLAGKGITEGNPTSPTSVSETTSGPTATDSSDDDAL